MAVNASQLLKLLEPTVRPMGIAAPARTPRLPIEGQSFDDLLAQASKGAMSSGRQVETGFDVEPPLDGAQLERIASAADQAEAAGARKALVLIDGRAFALDVQSRTLTMELSARSDVRVLQLDTAIAAPADAEEEAPSIPLAPGVGLLNGGKPFAQ